MDDAPAVTAMRHVERNPMRAKMTRVTIHLQHRRKASFIHIQGPSP